MIDVLIAFAVGQIVGVLILMIVVCFVVWRWWNEKGQSLKDIQKEIDEAYRIAEEGK